MMGTGLMAGLPGKMGSFQASCHCSCLGSDGTWGAPTEGRVEVLPSATGQMHINITCSSGSKLLDGHPISGIQVNQPKKQILVVSAPGVKDGICISLKLDSPDTCQKLQQLLSPVHSNGSAVSVFEQKTDKGSAELYFKYYGCLQHQQNMIQDYVRTGIYCSAICNNPQDFAGKVVLDVGAGSGILSLFAAQAGARKVYAVEASGMAKFARRLADGQPELGHIIQVVHSKIEEAQIPEKVDVLISEPMGTLLVNERMLETYLYARDHFLKPGGKMFPHLGRIHVAAFSDEALHTEIASKSLFWTQNNLYGLDMTPLLTAAAESYFAQVVVDVVDPSVLVSTCASHVFDFSTCTETDLHEFSIPLQLQVTTGPCTIHGVATWFDVLFAGSQSALWLSTAPGQPTTHWFQLRCVLTTPLIVPGPGCILTGTLRLVAHRHQSYDVHLTLQGPPLTPGGPPQLTRGSFDLKEPYYRQLTTGWWPAQGTNKAAEQGDYAQGASAGASQQYQNQ